MSEKRTRAWYIKRIVLLFCAVCLGNFLYWGIPESYLSRLSPDKQYIIVSYDPQYSLYGWFLSQHPYFVKVYRLDGAEYKYICTSRISAEEAMTPILWPDDYFHKIVLGLDLRIPEHALQGRFISLHPTLERVCP